MPIRHVVRRGEYISSIAARHGLFPKTIWGDPANAELTGSRISPGVVIALQPGLVKTGPHRVPRSPVAGRRSP